MSVQKKIAQVTVAFGLAGAASFGPHKAADYFEQKGFEQGHSAGYAQGYGNGVSNMNSIRFQKAACDDFYNGIPVVRTDDFGRTRTKYGVIPSEKLCDTLGQRTGEVIKRSLDLARSHQNRL